jgi:hypothetical protein
MFTVDIANGVSRPTCRTGGHDLVEVCPNNGAYPKMAADMEIVMITIGFSTGSPVIVKYWYQYCTRHGMAYEKLFLPSGY